MAFFVVGCRYHYQPEQKHSICNQFYELGDNIKQNSYPMGNLSVCNVISRRHGSYNDSAEAFTVSMVKEITLKFASKYSNKCMGLLETDWRH